MYRESFRLIAILTIFITFSCVPTKTINKVDDISSTRDYRITEYTGTKKKVAVTKFTNNTRFGQRRLGDNITNILITELGKTNRFLLLERERVDQILEEFKLLQSGLTSSTIKQIQLLDTDFLVTGAVTHYSVATTGSSDIFTKSKIQTAEVAIDIRVINVRTGAIVLSETGRGKAEKKFSQFLGMGSEGNYDESLEMDAFRTAAVKATENIINALDKLPNICDVVKISGKKMYIDAGKKSNVKVGDQIEIYKKGEILKDLSGYVLGYEETFLCSGRVVDYMGEDAAIVEVETSNNQFQLPLIGKLKK